METPRQMGISRVDGFRTGVKTQEGIVLTNPSRKMLAPLTTLDHKERSVFPRGEAEFSQCVMNYFTWADIAKVRTRETRNEHRPWRCPMV